MALEKRPEEISPAVRVLKYLARCSAWLLLAAAVVLVVSGWGISRTEIVYKATFGLVDRRLANTIHGAANLPAAFFFLSHVLANLGLAFTRRSPRKARLVCGVLLASGLLLFSLVLYVEFLA